jgi:tetratricopeptide (TPR) repeat protein
MIQANTLEISRLGVEYLKNAFSLTTKPELTDIPDTGGDMNRFNAVETLRNDFKKYEVPINKGDINMAVKALGAWVTFLNDNQDEFPDYTEIIQEYGAVIDKCYNALRERGLTDSELDKKLGISADLGRTYILLGTIYQLKFRDWQKAIGSIEKGLKCNPHEDEANLLNHAYYNLGVCYEELGELRKAIDNLRAAVAIKADDLDALFNLGQFTARIMDYDSSKAAFKQYLEYCPHGEGADAVREILESDPFLSDLSDEEKEVKAFTIAHNCIKNEQYSDAIFFLKGSLFLKNISLKARMIIHHTLAVAITKEWAPPSTLTHEEINEMAANLDMAAHIYDYFIKDSTIKAKWEGLRDNAKANLTAAITGFGASYKVGRGQWSTPSTLCAVFNDFEGYPMEYCQINDEHLAPYHRPLS